MKIKTKFFAVFLALAVVACARAGAQTVTTNFYYQTVNAPIPTANPNGYNTAIDVSGIIGTITDLSVFLNVTNGYNGDLYVYLDNPLSVQSVLLNRVGTSSTNSFGYADSGFNLTLDALATNNIHFYQTLSYSLNSAGQLTGTWAADGRAIDPESTPSAFDSAPTTAGLNLDLGSNPNGEWTLFVTDLNSGYPSSLVSWGLEIQTVPEPSSFALLAMAAVAALLFPRRRPARPTSPPLERK